MFGKASLSLFFLLLSSSCFGQVAATGGYATTTTSSPATTPAVNPAAAPLVSTPDIALPGSGPAMGAPVTANNDPRTSTGPSVADHNGFGPILDEGSAAAASNRGLGTQNSASPQSFEFGIQQFQAGPPSNGAAAQSLGDIARRYRGQRRQVRSFDNNSIAQLNAEGVQTGNLGAGSPTVTSNATVPSPESINTLMARNEAPALPQSDQDMSLPSRQASPTAIQQRHANAQQTQQTAPAPAASATEPQSASAGQNSEASSKLPQTGSALPLLLVIGALGIGGGTLYLVRR